MLYQAERWYNPDYQRVKKTAQEWVDFFFDPMTPNLERDVVDEMPVPNVERTRLRHRHAIHRTRPG
jgi:hypothetical protein